MSAEREYRIAVFAGPSGGHLFPAIAFIEAFRAAYPSSRIDLITGQKGSRFSSSISTGVDQIHYFPDFPSTAGISLRTLLFLLKLAQAFIYSHRLLSVIKPDLCVGFGSYASYPGIVLSSWKKIPTLIHEQNFMPGKATASLLPHADLVATTFEETFREKRGLRREVTGLPIRESLRFAAEKTSTKSGETVQILVVGGSQGSHRLNEVVLSAFSSFSPEEKAKIAVTHIAGNNDFNWVRQEYGRLGVKTEVYPFFERMNELYSRADVAVTRAGANTLFELALFRVPAIVIPYPFAGNHQKANAKSFEARGAVIVRDEAILTPDWLYSQLRGLSEDSARRQKMAQAMTDIAKPDAAGRMVALAERFLAGDAKWAPLIAT